MLRSIISRTVAPCLASAPATAARRMSDCRSREPKTLPKASCSSKRFCEASPRASARLPPICPGSNVHRRSFSRRRIHRRCGQQDRLLTACSPILDWVQTIFGIRSLTSSRGPRQRAALRKISKSGKSLLSTAVRIGTSHSARWVPCWPSWPDMSSATETWKLAAYLSHCVRRCSNCADGTAHGLAKPISNSFRNSACPITCRGVFRSAAIHKIVLPRRSAPRRLALSG